MLGFGFTERFFLPSRSRREYGRSPIDHRTMGVLPTLAIRCFERLARHGQRGLNPIPREETSKNTGAGGEMGVWEELVLDTSGRCRRRRRLMMLNTRRIRMRVEPVDARPQPQAPHATEPRKRPWLCPVGSVDRKTRENRSSPPVNSSVFKLSDTAKWRRYGVVASMSRYEIKTKQPKHRCDQSFGLA